MFSSASIKSFLIAGWPSIALLICIVVLELLRTLVGDSLSYQRTAIINGEYWRLITGQLVHSNLYHSLLNSAGLGLMIVVFAREQSPQRDLITLTVCAGIVAIGLFVFAPYMEVYKGLSGVLHGYLIYYLFVGMQRTPVIAGIALAAVLAKVGWEQTSFADLSETAALIDSAVAIEAHLSGAIGGLIIGCFTYYTMSHSNNREEHKRRT